MALSQSGEPIGGTAEPQGIAATCHAVAKLPSGLAGCVQPNNAVDCVIVVAVKVFGLVQVGGGPQVTLAFHPAALVVALEVNTNDKHPLGFVAVNDGGKVVPVYVPRIGDVIKFPFLITKLSPAAKLNEGLVCV